MKQPVTLEIGLSRPGDESYRVELRFSRPEDRAEAQRVSAPAHFPLDRLSLKLRDPAAYGRILMEGLFGDPEVRAYFEQVLALTGDQGRPLRLLLRVDPSAPELHNLRWETLRTLDDGDFLSTSQNLLFSRYLVGEGWDRIELRPLGDLRALVMVANPRDLAKGEYRIDGQTLAPVPVADELKRARQVLEAVPTVHELASHPDEPGRASLANLARELRVGYDIVYLACHGALWPLQGKDRKPYLWLEDEDGYADEVQGEDLVKQVQKLEASRRPGLVVLASCQSAGEGKVETADRQGALAALGPRLARAGIAAVVAMQGNVRMETAGRFMPAFFESLTESGRVDLAMAVAREQAVLGGSRDWWVPVLFSRLRDGRLLAPEEVPAGASRPEFCDNLKEPDYSVFVGREKELARVHKALLPGSRERIITIDGIRGIGKSTLALEAARHYCDARDTLPAEERFEAIIYTSAEQTHLAPAGIDDPGAGVRALEAISKTIAVTLKRDDIARTELEERLEMIIEVLKCKRILLIVDNLELVDDKHVARFLKRVRAPSKVLVTTRQRMRSACRVHLKEMPQQRALELIAQECEAWNVPLSASEARQLYERTGGMPLAVEWSVGRLADEDPLPNVLHGLTRSDTDLVEVIFKGSVGSLEREATHAYYLLLASALFASDASREALCRVSGIQDKWHCGDGLVHLLRRSLLNRDKRDRFSWLPLTRSYLKHELDRTPDFIREASKEMLLYYQELVTPPVLTGVPYWDGLFNETGAKSLESEQLNLLHTIHRALEEGQKQEALNLFLPIVHFLGGWGLWDERERLSEKMCQIAEELGNTAAVWLWVDSIAWIRLERRQVPECLDALRKGRSLAREFDMPYAVALADAWESALRSREDKLSDAREIINPALEVIDVDSALESGDIVHCAVAARVVRPAAELSEKEKKLEQAEKLYEQELELRKKAGENAAAPLVSLGNVNLELGDFKEAEERFQEALKDAKRNETAWSYYGLARVAEHKKEFSEAQEWCELALDAFRGLGLTDAEQKARQCLGRVEAD